MNEYKVKFPEQYKTLESVAQTIGINMLQIRIHELEGLTEEAEKIRSFNTATVEFMENLIKEYIGQKKSEENPPSLVEKIGQEMAKDIIGVEPLKPPESLGKLLAERYAKEIVDVQPMSGDAIKMMEDTE